MEYQGLELEVLYFQSEDVILTSGPTSELDYVSTSTED